jgi:hypothetical protein
VHTLLGSRVHSREYSSRFPCAFAFEAASLGKKKHWRLDDDNAKKNWRLDDDNAKKKHWRRDDANAKKSIGVVTMTPMLFSQKKKALASLDDANVESGISCPVPGICARARLKRRMRRQRSLHRWGSAGSAAAEEPSENARGRVARRRALRRALRADDHSDCCALCQVYVPSRN